LAPIFAFIGSSPFPVAGLFGRQLRGPHDALIFLGYRRQALVEKFLDALSAIGLRGEDVAFGIGGDAVHPVELSWLAPAFAKRREDFERIAVDDVNAVVFAIGKVDIFLLRVL